MLSLIFLGYFNSNLKINLSREYTSISYLNLYFFILLVKKYILLDNINVSIYFSIMKKKKKSIFFTKADFKYKTTKHSVTKFQRNFSLKLKFNNNLYYNNINFIFLNKYFKLLSNVYLNISYIKQNILYKNTNFFIYKK